jgi:fatty acid desaturase
VLFPNFGALMNLHFTGAVDLLQGNGRESEFDFVHDRSAATKKDVAKRVLRKFVPYYAKEYVLFPLLAGPFFWKVMLGNWLSEMMRDVYSAATIYCGHVGEHTATYAEGTRPKGKGHWYEMQVEASNNFEVPYVLSVFCGALDKQIEHHLFPKLPTQRLRKVAPEVKAICAEHGVRYHTDSWPRTLKKALAQIARLSGPVETLRAAA